MRYLVTGASGFIGSAVAADLLAAGHEVVGLVRSEESAAKVRAAGVEPHLGNLDDFDDLKLAAAASDGVLHLGYRHDMIYTGGFHEAAELDRVTVAALAEALEGTDKPLVMTSGLAGLATGRVAVETDEPLEGSPGSARRPAELAALSAAERGVRSSVVRLPPSVHGPGDGGFIPGVIAVAREKGVAAYVGDGQSNWSAVHRLDAARVFRLAAESAPAGSVFHAIGDQGVPFRAITETIGRHLGLPVESIAADAAADHFGFFAMFASLDMRADGPATREALGWEPTHDDLLTDLDANYFG